MQKQKNNAVCSICGREYYMCLSCKDMISLNPWKRYTDTSEHYKIFQIIRGYSTKVYDKHEAYLKLKMVDLSDFNNLRDNIKEVINEIMTVNKVEENNSSALVPDDINLDKEKIVRRKKSFKVVETELNAVPQECE